MKLLLALGVLVGTSITLAANPAPAAAGEPWVSFTSHFVRIEGTDFQVQVEARREGDDPPVISVRLFEGKRTTLATTIRSVAYWHVGRFSAGEGLSRALLHPTAAQMKSHAGQIDMRWDPNGPSSHPVCFGHQRTRTGTFEGTFRFKIPRFHVDSTVRAVSLSKLPGVLRWDDGDCRYRQPCRAGSSRLTLENDDPFVITERGDHARIVASRRSRFTSGDWWPFILVNQAVVPQEWVTVGGSLREATVRIGPAARPAFRGENTYTADTPTKTSAPMSCPDSDPVVVGSTTGRWDDQPGILATFLDGTARIRVQPATATRVRLATD